MEEKIEALLDAYANACTAYGRAAQYSEIEMRKAAMEKAAKEAEVAHNAIIAFVATLPKA